MTFGWGAVASVVINQLEFTILALHPPLGVCVCGGNRPPAIGIDKISHLTTVSRLFRFSVVQNKCGCGVVVVVVAANRAEP